VPTVFYQLPPTRWKHHPSGPPGLVKKSGSGPPGLVKKGAKDQEKGNRGRK